MPQYTTIQDFPAIIFSHLAWGIYFFKRVHVMRNYSKNKGLDLGKFTSSPNLHASFQSLPKINCMLIMRLICIQ